MKRLLIVTSMLEGATGLALITVPAFVINLLLGSHLTDSTSIIVVRIAGTALFSLSIACWSLRNNERVTGLVVALLFYNLASVVLLGYGGLYENLAGKALWPAVVTHIGMVLWSLKLILFNGNIKFQK